MSLHELARIPRLILGTGARGKLPSLALEAAGAGARVLFVADPGLRAGGKTGEVAGLLRGAGFAVEIFDAFGSDPTIAQADAAAQLAREAAADLVIAFGGGSAIDLGKAVAAIASASDSALAYELCRQPFPSRRLPCICVPTTSGTGAETTRTSVLTRADKAKIWLWGDAVKSDLVVLDPELTVTLPPHLTAATGIDALVHAVEAATNRNAHAANNVYAHEAIRLVAGNLEQAVREPGDLAARAAMQRAAALGGVAIDNCGTALAHSIGHALASLRPIHHGLAVGVAMTATLSWSIEADDGSFAACSQAMGGKLEASDFVRRFERLVRAVALPLSLAERFAGVEAESVARQMTAPENLPMLASSRRTPSETERVELARMVLEMA